MIAFLCSLLHFSDITANCQDYGAWIRTDTPVPGVLKVEALCEALEDGYVRYELKAEKTGRSGKTKSSQNGRVYLEKGKAKILSQLRLGVSPDDAYQIRLELYKEGKLVAEDSLVRH